MFEDLKYHNPVGPSTFDSPCVFCLPLLLSSAIPVRSMDCHSRPTSSMLRSISHRSEILVQPDPLIIRDPAAKPISNKNEERKLPNDATLVNLTDSSAMQEPENGEEFRTGFSHSYLGYGIQEIWQRLPRQPKLYYTTLLEHSEGGMVLKVPQPIRVKEDST
ncbi:uncharacterized protein CLUP02_02229 [Colletotrichum lupini]|uniref:Uncharacterized protein n=1 Tax=Colletotrichum lupini TaxID=145971 RepID=A0A9Q8SDV7_9PEZI|nr:uncharacterized protein CLUP02_02229 [Colletotrichum lupini]UQC75574.1 hypothetical protein CLUP02_02229 [Colletotrichum lupini]